MEKGCGAKVHSTIYATSLKLCFLPNNHIWRRS